MCNNELDARLASFTGFAETRLSVALSRPRFVLASAQLVTRIEVDIYAIQAHLAIRQLAIARFAQRRALSSRGSSRIRLFQVRVENNGASEL